MILYLEVTLKNENPIPGTGYVGVLVVCGILFLPVQLQVEPYYCEYPLVLCCCGLSCRCYRLGCVEFFFVPQMVVALPFYPPNEHHTGS